MHPRKVVASLACLVLVGGLLTALPSGARAHTYQSNSADAHVLRLVAYVLHPVGVLLEWGITRPVHWVASQDQLDIILGHKAHVGDVFFEWSHEDHTPGIAQQRRQDQQAAAEAMPAPKPDEPAPATTQ